MSRPNLRLGRPTDDPVDSDPGCCVIRTHPFGLTLVCESRNRRSGPTRASATLCEALTVFVSLACNRTVRTRLNPCCTLHVGCGLSPTQHPRTSKLVGSVSRLDGTTASRLFVNCNRVWCSCLSAEVLQSLHATPPLRDFTVPLPPVTPTISRNPISSRRRCNVFELSIWS